MTTQDKKSPAYTDTDIMPFGKYKGSPLSDIPASYLLWLYDQKPLSNLKLENYIYNSLDALRMETKDK